MKESGQRYMREFGGKNQKRETQLNVIFRKQTEGKVGRQMPGVKMFKQEGGKEEGEISGQ